jgi:DNA-binding MarR family transcriptional regulator
MVVGVAMQRPTDEDLRIWRGYLESHTRLIRRLDLELQENHDLPLDWYDVLVQLHEAGGRRSMGGLANAMLISPSNCSRLVDRLAVQGLVRREADMADGRVKHAVLTAAGRDALRTAAPTHLDGIVRYFTRFLANKDANRQLFHSVLDALGYDIDDPGRGGGT